VGDETELTIHSISVSSRKKATTVVQTAKSLRETLSDETDRQAWSSRDDCRDRRNAMLCGNDIVIETE